MPKEIKKQWDIQSSSDPKKSYKVTQYSDNTWACSCPQWIYRRKICHHITQCQNEENTKQLKL